MSLVTVANRKLTIDSCGQYNNFAVSECNSVPGCEAFGIKEEIVGCKSERCKEEKKQTTDCQGSPIPVLKTAQPGALFRIPFHRIGGNQVWSVRAQYQTIKAKDQERLQVSVTLEAPVPLLADKKHTVIFAFGSPKKVGTELFKCGWDPRRSDDGLFSKQFSPREYGYFYNENEFVNDYSRVNTNWSVSQRPSLQGTTLSCTASRAIDGPDLPLEMNMEGVKAYFQFYSENRVPKETFEWGKTVDFPVEITLENYVSPPTVQPPPVEPTPIITPPEPQIIVQPATGLDSTHIALIVLFSLCSFATTALAICAARNRFFKPKKFSSKVPVEVIDQEIQLPQDDNKTTVVDIGESVAELNCSEEQQETFQTIEEVHPILPVLQEVLLPPENNLDWIRESLLSLCDHAVQRTEDLKYSTGQTRQQSDVGVPQHIASPYEDRLSELKSMKTSEGHESVEECEATFEQVNEQLEQLNEELGRFSQGIEERQAEPEYFTSHYDLSTVVPKLRPAETQGHFNTAGRICHDYNTGNNATKQSTLVEGDVSVDSDIAFDSEDDRVDSLEHSFVQGHTTFHIERRTLPLLKMPSQICTYSVKQKQKSIKEAARDKSDNIVSQTVRKLCWAISEQDFDRMHKLSNSAYGFCDKPKLTKDVETVVRKLAQLKKRRAYTTDMLIIKVARYRHTKLKRTGAYKNSAHRQVTTQYVVPVQPELARPTFPEPRNDPSFGGYNYRNGPVATSSNKASSVNGQEYKIIFKEPKSRTPVSSKSTDAMKRTAQFRQHIPEPGHTLEIVDQAGLLLQSATGSERVYDKAQPPTSRFRPRAISRDEIPEFKQSYEQSNP